MLLPLSSDAAPKVIEMLNRQNDEMMVFSIPLLQVKSGETVTFKATDLTHSVAFVDGGVPAGVSPLKGVFNTDTSYTFEKPGIYVYKCPAHYGMGMIGAVVVDKNHDNLAAVKSLELMPAAQKRLNQILSHHQGYGDYPTSVAHEDEEIRASGNFGNNPLLVAMSNMPPSKR